MVGECFQLLFNVFRDIFLVCMTVLLIKMQVQFVTNIARTKLVSLDATLEKAYRAS